MQTINLPLKETLVLAGGRSRRIIGTQRNIKPIRPATSIWGDFDVW
jgi:hypothetical protein